MIEIVIRMSYIYKFWLVTTFSSAPSPKCKKGNKNAVHHSAPRRRYMDDVPDPDICIVTSLYE